MNNQREPTHDALTVVVPMYNETHRVVPNVAELVQFLATLPEGSELIFVDDGSTDGTADLVEKMLAEKMLAERMLAEQAPHRNVRVLRCIHAGKGAAVRSGLLAATTPLAGFCDIDLSTPLSSLVEIALSAQRAPVLAIGSRDVVGARVIRHESTVREFLGRTYNRAVQTIVTPGILDTQCGAKVARREVWAGVLEHSREDGFAWDVEICALAIAAGVPVLEVPVEWLHDDGSNINVARDGMRMVAALPRIRERARRAARAATAPRTELRWQDRSSAALLVGVLRRYAHRQGRLVDLAAGTGAVTTRLGWEPRALVALAHNVPANPLGILIVVADAADPPIASGLASVAVLHGATLNPETATAAAHLLEPNGLFVALVPGGDPRASSGVLRSAGFRIELTTSAFTWCSPRRLASGSGRGALLLGALERIAISRFGVRPPRGAAALVVARRLAR